MERKIKKEFSVAVSVDSVGLVCNLSGVEKTVAGSTWKLQVPP